MNENTEPRSIDLSLPQIVGGSVAAATAAALSTRLGLVGTIAGAAFASIISAVVAASLSAWMQRAGQLAVRRAPTRLRSLAIGLCAVALVAFAFRAGVDLLVSDLPQDTFAARWLAELGVGPRPGSS
jgi:integral membrane sensor domain MASE1